MSDVVLVILLPLILVGMCVAFILFMMMAAVHLILFLTVSGALISKRKDGMLGIWVVVHVVWVSAAVYYNYVPLYYELFQLLKYFDALN